MIGQSIESVYPDVNGNDEYVELLNITFTPRDVQQSSLETSTRIMWSGLEKEIDRIWPPNYFIPILNISQSISSIGTESAIETVDDKIEYTDTNETQSQTITSSNKLTTWYTAQIGKENKSKTANSVPTLDKKYSFF